MAADFWESSQCKCWLFSKHEVHENFQKQATTPAGEPASFTVDQIRLIKSHYAGFIQALGRELKMKQRVVSTAIVYFRRFYYKNKLEYCDPELVAPTVLLMASKLEEHALSAIHIRNGLQRLNTRLQKGDVLNRIYYHMYSISEMLECECYVLGDLDFQINIFHPYNPLELYIEDSGTPEYLQSAWCIINDTYRMTDLCLMYPPYIIALAAMYIVGIMNYRAPSPKYPGPLANTNTTTNVECQAKLLKWFEALNVDMHVVGEVALEITNSYKFFRELYLSHQNMHPATSASTPTAFTTCPSPSAATPSVVTATSTSNSAIPLLAREERDAVSRLRAYMELIRAADPHNKPAPSPMQSPFVKSPATMQQ